VGETRDLLRRRSFFVRQRAQLIAHIQNTNSQYNLPPFDKKLTYQGNRSAEIAERFDHPSTQLSIASDLNLIASYDTQIAALNSTSRKAPRLTTRPPSNSCGPCPASDRSSDW
jgi:hypothetical protein